MARAVAEVGSAIADAISRPRHTRAMFRLLAICAKTREPWPNVRFARPATVSVAVAVTGARGLPSRGILAAAEFAARLDAVRSKIRAAGFHRYARHPA